MINYTLTSCDLGYVLIAYTVKGIRNLQLGDSPQDLERTFLADHPDAERSDQGLSRQVLKKIVNYIENPISDIQIEIDPQGTDFQKRVWNALQEIPPGRSETYTSLSIRLGDIKAIRAVATACGANPIAVIIPCHRVLRSDGTLAGYRWGLWRKQALLEREGNLLL